MKISKFQIFTYGVMVLGLSYIIYNNVTTEDKILSSDIKYLPYELKGQKNSDFLIIFLHGFPNTMRMWDNMINDLEKEFYCLNISYPNYSKELELKWGIDLKDLTDLIKKTIDYVEKSSDGKIKYKKILVAHDWGAFFAYLLSQKYENYFTDMITMDVGTGIEDTVSAKLYTIAYQSYLATNFLIGGPIGKYMTKLFVKLADPYGLTKEDMNRLNSSWNYPYYYIWRTILNYKKSLDRYEIKIPIAYVYGIKKPFNFHNEKFLTQLKNCKKCEVHALDSDHWLMRKPENLKFLVDLVRKRIKYHN